MLLCESSWRYRDKISLIPLGLLANIYIDGYYHPPFRNPKMKREINGVLTKYQHPHVEFLIQTSEDFNFAKKKKNFHLYLSCYALMCLSQFFLIFMSIFSGLYPESGQIFPPLSRKKKFKSYELPSSTENVNSQK